MIIEFELQGSKQLHKGIFDTTGFWVKWEEEGEHVLDVSGQPTWRVDGYKIFSHFSFCFYHHDKAVCDLVYSRLVSMLRGSNSIDIEDVGYFRRLNK
jgi:hypothetical protein